MDLHLLISLPALPWRDRHGATRREIGPPPWPEPIGRPTFTTWRRSARALPSCRQACPETPLERESMEYDVVIVGAGPGRAGRRDPAQAAGGGARTRRSRSACWRRAPRSGAHILSGACLEPRALNELIPDWQERARRWTRRSRGRFLYLTESRSYPAADAAADAQRGQLHRQPRQRRALARAAGRGAGGRDLSGLRRGRAAAGRGGPGARGRHRQHGRDQGRRGGAELPAGDGAARQADAAGRGLPRLADQDRDGAVQAARGRAAADLRAGRQGAVGDRARAPQPGAR